MSERSLPYACVPAAAILVLVIPPPAKLAAWIGSDVWARLGLGTVVTLVLFMLLMMLGLAAGKVGLPLGLSLERGDPSATTALASDLEALRAADERIFERFGQMATLLESAFERITLLEDHLPATDPADDV